MKNKYILIVLLLIIVGAVVLFVATMLPVNVKKTPAPVVPTPAKDVLDYKNISYMVDGESVTLKNGVHVGTLPESSATVTTRYFGNEVKSDFDGDGRKDIAFLLVQNGGGTGTFYFLVVAWNRPGGYIGGGATFIGERIAPQTTEVNAKGFIVVNYADRKPGESFAVEPSVGKSIWFKFDPKTMQLGEVVQNFEGESR